MASAVNLQDFEQAVLIVTQNDSRPGAFQQATQYIQQLSSLPNSYQLCVQLLLLTSQPDARFFALQALCKVIDSQAYASMDGGARTQLRQTLLEYTRAKCMSGSVERNKMYVEMKLALAFALMIKADYPDQLQAPFAELLALVHACGGLAPFTVPRPGGEPGVSDSAAPAMHACDTVNRVLEDLHREIVDPYIHRSPEVLARCGIVKDAMRTRGDAQAIVEFWYAMLSASVGPIKAVEAACGLAAPPTAWPASSVVLSTATSSCVQMAVHILKVMAKYADWFDIKLFAHEAAVRLHVQMLGSAYLRNATAGLLLALVQKGTDPASRLALMQCLQLVDITRQLAHDALACISVKGDTEAAYGRTGFEDDFEFGWEVSKLVAAVTGSLIEAGETESVTANQAACAWTADSLRMCVGLLLRLLDRSDLDVNLGLAVLPTINVLVACLQREMRAANGSAVAPGVGKQQRAVQDSAGLPPGRPAGVSTAEFMPILLTVVTRQFVFPADHEPASSGDDDDSYQELREGLRKVFVNIVRIAPDAVLAQLTGAAAAPVLDGSNNDLVHPGVVHDACATAPWSPAALLAIAAPGAPWQVAERALMLLYLYGEGAGINMDGSSASVQLKARNGPLYDAVMSALAFGPTMRPGMHVDVLKSFLELASRYAAVLVPPKGAGASVPAQVQAQAGPLYAVLQVFVGPTGIRHPLASVQSRSAYLLVKLVKALSSVHVGSDTLASLAGVLLQSIAEFLVVQPPTVGNTNDSSNDKGATITGRRSKQDTNPMQFSDAEHLFEAAGVLLGFHGPAPAPDGSGTDQYGIGGGLSLPAETRIAYTEAVFTPLITGIEAALASLTGANGRPLLGLAGQGGASVPPEVSEAITTYVVSCLSALGHLSKGLGSVGRVERLAQLLERAMGAALSAVYILVGQSGVASKTIFLMHRCIESLDVRLVRSLPACLPVLLGLGCADGTRAGSHSDPASLVPIAFVGPEHIGHVLAFLTQSVLRFGHKEVAAGADRAGAGCSASLDPLEGVPSFLQILNGWMVALSARVGSVLQATMPTPPGGGGAAARRQRGQSEVDEDESGNGSCPGSSEGEEARARVDLWRAWVQMLHVCAQNPGIATAALGTGRAAAALPQVLGSLLEPLSGGSAEPALSRACLVTVSNLVRSWLPVAGKVGGAALPSGGAGAAGQGSAGSVTGASFTPFPAVPVASAGATPVHPVRVDALPSPLPEPVVAAFVAWLLEHGLAATWRAALAPNFDTTDAQAASMAAEAIALQATIAVHVAAVTGAPPPSTCKGGGQVQGVDALTLMATKMLPGLGVDPALAAAYCDRLRGSLAQPKDARPQYLAVVGEIKRCARPT